MDTSWWRTPWTAKERSVIFFVRMGCNLGKGSQPDDSEVREDGKRVASGATSPQTPPPGALADRMADGHVPNKDSNALMSLDTHIEDQGLCFLGVYCHALHARFFFAGIKKSDFLIFFRQCWNTVETTWSHVAGVVNIESRTSMLIEKKSSDERQHLQELYAVL